MILKFGFLIYEKIYHSFTFLASLQILIFCQKSGRGSELCRYIHSSLSDVKSGAFLILWRICIWQILFWIPNNLRKQKLIKFGLAVLPTLTYLFGILQEIWAYSCFILQTFFKISPESLWGSRKSNISTIFCSDINGSHISTIQATKVVVDNKKTHFFVEGTVMDISCIPSLNMNWIDLSYWIFSQQPLVG